MRRWDNGRGKGVRMRRWQAGSMGGWEEESMRGWEDERTGSRREEGWREEADKAVYHDSLERVCPRQTPSRSPSPGRRYVTSRPALRPPPLGGQVAPKSFQSGLEVACHGQSENLQIPCVLQYFCGPVGVPSRLKIVFKAVLSSSLGISIFVSFLNPFLFT